MARGLALVTGASSGAMRGKQKVVAESPLSKVMGLANRVTPDSVKAVASRLISLPVGRN
jgi:hypothetical protein